MRAVFITTILLLCFSKITLADAGEQHLKITDLVIRATTSQAGATAAYVTIHNHGNSDERLIGINAEFAKKSEIHEMKLVGDVMKMRPLADGIIIPAGGMATLQKGGNHLMFMGLKEPISLGGDYQITFQFETAGTITLQADTISLSGKKSAKHDDHSSHSDHSSDNDHSGHSHKH